MDINGEFLLFVIGDLLKYLKYIMSKLKGVFLL